MITARLTDAEPIGDGTRRFLLCMWEGGGTVPPELGLARELIARGHEVHVLADPTIEAEALAAGCLFHSWVEAPHCDARTPEAALIRDWEYKNPLSAIKVYLRDFLCGPAARAARDTLHVIDEAAIDVVLNDYALIGPSMAAELRGLPRVALMPNIYIIPTKGIPPLGPGLAPARGPLGRARDAVLRTVTTRMFNSTTDLVNEQRKELGLAPVDSTFEQVLNVDTLLVLTSRSFDFPSDYLPANVIYAGPVLADPTWSNGAESWVPPWPEDNDDPIVLVALSSTFQDQRALLYRIIEGLATLPVRALVTLGEQLDVADFPDRGNVVVVQHAPHTEVIARAAAVVTHCGHGTTIKALAAGVPMVCIPMGRDQNDTAARVVARGAGVRLKPSAPASKIADATNRVLQDHSYSAAAQKLGQRIHAELDAAPPAEILLASCSAAPRT